MQAKHKMNPCLLVVDDDSGIRRILEDTLVADGYDVRLAADGKTALELAAQNEFNAALLDYQLPDMDGLAVLRGLLERCPNLPVVMVTGHASYELAVKAMKLGAFNFVTKPVNDESLLAMVRNAVEQDSLQRQVRYLSEELYEQFEMVGTSSAMQRLYEAIDKVAHSRASVLILGESGVGKELTARAIHRKSGVASGPFVRINCAAIPQELIESELFGHERGAFTGAHAAKRGKVEAADKGTLFLDEIGDMAISAQAKLLRFLQEGELERVGGTRTIKVDVRAVSATNKNLAEEIKQRRFREDLYFRLNVVTLVVPPLRERKKDIPSLAEHFTEKYCDEHGVPRKELTSDALNLLAAQQWPGNVREFANVIQRCVVMLSQSTVTAKDIGPLLSAETDLVTDDSVKRSLREARDDFERKHVLSVLSEKGWNMTEAAKVLEIDRTSLYRLMDRLGIKPADD